MRIREAWLTLGLTVAGCGQEFRIVGDGDGAGAGDAPDLSTPTGTDVIRQVNSTAVDVLWVLDDSGSMREEQDKLATNLGVFYDILDGSGLDWHIGVVTTDTTNLAEAGELRTVAGHAFLTEEIPYAQDLFEMLVRVGLGGSIDEMGLLTAYRAIAQPYANVIEANKGFLRDRASLHVIVVSDEDDSSQDFIETSEFADFLRLLKSDPETPVTFSSIVGPRPYGCENADTQASYGSRYVVMTQRVGGIHRSICEEDWAPVLEELGLLAAGRRSAYFLSEVPRLGTVEVTVRTRDRTWTGVEVDALEDVEAACGDDADCFGFRFDRVQNAVAMLDFLPPEGSRVRIHYELLSGAKVEDDVAP